MGERTKYAPGTFSWTDLATTDQDGAKQFYGQLFGWSAVDFPIDENTTYSMMQIGGKDVAEVRKHLFTPFGERFTIEVHRCGDMEIDGDLLSHEFTIQRDGQTVATISKSWLTMTASYAVEVAPGEDDLLILASVLALDLAIDAEHDH